MTADYRNKDVPGLKWEEVYPEELEKGTEFKNEAVDGGVGEPQAPGDQDGEGVIEWRWWADEDTKVPEGDNHGAREEWKRNLPPTSRTRRSSRPVSMSTTKVEGLGTLNSHMHKHTHKRACTHASSMMTKNGIFPSTQLSRSLLSWHTRAYVSPLTPHGTPSHCTLSPPPALPSSSSTIPGNAETTNQTRFALRVG